MGGQRKFTQWPEPRGRWNDDTTSIPSLRVGDVGIKGQDLLEDTSGRT